MKALIKFFSKKDCIFILDLINSLISCDNEDGFRALINKLKMLIPFDYAICGMSKLSSESRVSSFQILNISYPSDWLELYLNKQYHLIDPIVSEHYKNFNLQCWADTYRKYDHARKFIADARGFNLNDGYTLGIREYTKNLGSIFTLSGRHDQRSSRTEIILKTLMPHFHQTLLRLTNNFSNKLQLLTPREKEVLNWLKYGKTSWDVSRILNISERTVNFHCASLVQKLDAVNRSHAVAIAIDKGLVALD
jgi:DNA-binding CsgD family transcriptional regulator